MIPTWLTGKPRNKILHITQKAIDVLNKELVYLEKEEKSWRDTAAREYAEAKEFLRKNDRDGAVHCLKLWASHKRSAKYCQSLHEAVQERMIPFQIRKEVIESFGDEDFANKNQKTPHVFFIICFCVFLLILLAYFVI